MSTYTTGEASVPGPGAPEPVPTGSGNPYLDIVKTVRESIPERFQWRLAFISFRSIPHLVAGSPGIDRARLMFAAHLLTGPVLLRIVGSAGKDVGSAEALQLLTYRSFSPSARAGIIHEHIENKIIDRRVGPELYGVAVSCDTRSDILLGQIQRAVEAVSGFDSVGEQEMCDLAVALLAPPAAMVRYEDTTGEGQ
jgi:hypothetical protein